MFERPKTSQEAVQEELRRRIVDSELKPGTALRQDSIAAELGVSRVPVREALKFLEGEGQVIYKPHRGYYVAELTMKDVIEIYRIRELLENEALREGVPKLTSDDFDRMLACMEEMERSESLSVRQLAEANSRFHLTLVEACGMPHLVKHIQLLRKATNVYRSLYYMSESARDRSNADHRAMYEAAVAADAAKLIEIADQHRRQTIVTLRGVLRAE